MTNLDAVIKRRKLNGEAKNEPLRKKSSQKTFHYDAEKFFDYLAEKTMKLEKKQPKWLGVG